MVLERPPALSLEGELIQAWLEGGSWTLPEGQGTLLRRPHCRHNPGLSGPLLSYSTELSAKSKVIPEAVEGAAARTGMALRSLRPRGPHLAGLWSSGNIGSLGTGWAGGPLCTHLQQLGYRIPQKNSMPTMAKE